MSLKWWDIDSDGGKLPRLFHTSDQALKALAGVLSVNLAEASLKAGPVYGGAARNRGPEEPAT